MLLVMDDDGGDDNCDQRDIDDQHDIDGGGEDEDCVDGDSRFLSRLFRL